ncbi:MAG: zonular occludens toxin domain-containing protein [Nitrososphaerota archaeon]
MTIPSGKTRFLTGISELDRITGGLPGSRLLLVSGEEKSGRTSLVLQMCAIASSQGRDCMIVDSGMGLHIERMRSVFEAWGADQTRIWISSPKTLRDQTRLVLKAAELCGDGGLIAVDEATHLYRVELTGIPALDKPRYMELTFEMAVLKEAALRRDGLAVVVTEAHEVPVGGTFVTRPVAERITTYFADMRFWLENREGELKSLSYEVDGLRGTTLVRLTGSGLTSEGIRPRSSARGSR